MNLSTKVKNLIQFAYVSILLAWIVGFQVFLVRLALAGRLLFYTSSQGCHFTDFVVFYNWWRIAYTPFKNALYNPQVQMRFLSEMLGPLQREQLPFIQGTPFFFMLGAPLSKLSLPAAFTAWNAVTIILFLSGYLKCLSLFEQAGRTEKLLFLAAGCASFPVLSCERDGQTGALLAGIIGLFSYYWLKRNDIAAGASLSVLLLKPQYLPFLLIAPLAYGRWKVLISFVTAALLFTASALIFLGPEILINYPEVLHSAETNASGYLGIFSAWMVSIRGILIYFLSEKQAMHVSLSLMLAGLGLLFVLGRRVVVQNEMKLDAQFLSVLILSALVISPHTFTYDLHLLCIAAALGWYSCADALKGKTLRKLWEICFLLYPLSGMIFFVIMDRIQEGRLCAPFHLFPDLILLACAARLLLLQSQKHSTD